MTTVEGTASARLAGRVAVITGAARGQGRAAALRLASEGADVVALDVCATPATTTYPGASGADLAETASGVEALGRRVVAHEVDTRDLEALEAAVADGVGRLGGLDVVVANAGICSAGRLWEITAEQWRETLEVNLTGTFHTIKATVPTLLAQGRGGSIVMTSSVAGERGLPFLGHYAATKHGIVGLARTLANELGPHSVRVNTVLPFGVDTPLTHMTELEPLITEHATTLGPIYMGSLPEVMSRPEDIAATVAWLASDDARHVTGSAIPVDLGTLAR